MSVNTKIVLSAEDRATAMIRRASTSMAGLKSNLISVQAAFTAIGTGIVASQIGQAMDKVTNMENQIRLVTSSTARLNTVMDETYKIAADTRNSWSATTDLYARLARSTKGLEYSQQDLLDITESVNQAVAISGSTAQAAEAALFQLGQGLGAGALRGEELNSVLEQTPRLAQAIADGLGITIAELREMGSEGKLTAEKFVEAMRNEQETLRNESAQTVSSMGKGWGRLTDASTRFFGVMDDKLGITKAMAEALKNMAEGVDSVTDAMKSAGTVTSNNTIGSQVADLRAQLKKLDAEMAQRENMGLPIGHLQARYSMILGHVHQLESTYDRLLQLDQGMQDASVRAQQYMQQLGLNPPVRTPSPTSTKQPDPNYLSNTAAGNWWASNGYGMAYHSDTRAARAGANQAKEIEAYNNALAERVLAQTNLNGVTDSWLTKANEAADVRERAMQQLQDLNLAERSWSESALDGIDAYTSSIGTMSDRMESAITGSLRSVEDALVTVATTGKFEIGSMVDSIIADFARIAIQESITKPLAGAVSGFFAPNAIGGVYSGPGISAYSGKVVNSPTLFPFASGIGLMGEAGPEAIMPLTRTPSGKLGVESTGTGSAPKVTVNVINQSGERMQVSRQQTEQINAQEMVVTLWLDAFARNKMGLRSTLGGV